MIITIKVTPNAKKNACEGMHEGVLKIRLRAVPDKGKANEALIEFLSDLFDISKSAIRIVSGHTARLKRVEITGQVDLDRTRKKK
jgi:uncharacterized protein